MGRSPILSKSIKLCGITNHDLRVMGKTQLNEMHIGPTVNIVVDALIVYSKGYMAKYAFPVLPTHDNPALESLGT